MPNGIKQLLRNQLRRSLASFAESTRQEASEKIRSIIMAIPQYQSAKVIYGFVPLKSEPDWLGVSLPAGAQLYLPRSTGRSYRFAAATDSDQMEIGPLGVLQPPDDGSSPPPPDLALVPGLAFDKRGYRLGRGNGIYDRLLNGMPGFRVGVAFGVQLLPDVPIEAHDQPMDAIVTENGFLLCSGGKQNHQPATTTPQAGLQDRNAQ